MDRRKAQERARRRAQALGGAGILLAVALPVALWHDVVALIATDFRVEAVYLSGWVPWTLMGLGVACFLRVLWLDGLARRSRFHVHGGGAWMGWGVSLYVLGFALAFQVAQIAGGFAA
jgi:hypothetical protein